VFKNQTFCGRNGEKTGTRGSVEKMDKAYIYNALERFVGFGIEFVLKPKA